MTCEFPEISVKIFDWSVYRVFRDEEKNILKIVLEKDGIFQEFGK